MNETLQYLVSGNLNVPYTHIAKYLLVAYVCFEIQSQNALMNKMCLWNTMPPIMANSKEGQDHKDKYFDTSRKILSQEMTMCNMEALVSYPKEVMTNVIFFFKIGQMPWSKD